MKVNYFNLKDDLTGGDGYADDIKVHANDDNISIELRSTFCICIFCLRINATPLLMNDSGRTYPPDPRESRQTCYSFF